MDYACVRMKFYFSDKFINGWKKTLGPKMYAIRWNNEAIMAIDLGPKRLSELNNKKEYGLVLRWIKGKQGKAKQRRGENESVSLQWTGEATKGTRNYWKSGCDTTIYRFNG